MLGKEVLTQNANGKTEINISHLTQGVYNVQIISDGKIIGNSKIVKQKKHFVYFKKKLYICKIIYNS